MKDIEVIRDMLARTNLKLKADLQWGSPEDPRFVLEVLDSTHVPNHVVELIFNADGSLCSIGAYS